MPVNPRLTGGHGPNKLSSIKIAQPFNLMKTTPNLRFAVAFVGALALINHFAAAADLSGSVQGAGQPIAGSTVTVYAAGTGAPAQLAQGKTDDSGAFTLAVDSAPADSVLYVVAKGGTPKAATAKGPNDAI